MGRSRAATSGLSNSWSQAKCVWSPRAVSVTVSVNHGSDDVLDHDPGIGLNLPEDTLVGVVGTVRAVHHKDPPPAGLELELLERVREAARSPPLREAIRLLECREYLSGRTGETRSVLRTAFRFSLGTSDPESLCKELRYAARRLYRFRFMPPWRPPHSARRSGG